MMSGPDKRQSTSFLKRWLPRILFAFFVVGDILGIASWRGNLDIWKEAMTPMVSALVMVACSAGLGAFGLYYWQRIQASGVLPRTWKAIVGAVENAGAYLSSSAATDRAVVAYGFARCPQGQEPPHAKFSAGRKRVAVGPSWVRRVPYGTDPLWLARAFVSVNPITRRREAIAWPQTEVWDERYSTDKEDWHEGRKREDRYMRCRIVKNGSLIAPISLQESHLVPGPHDLCSFVLAWKEPELIQFDPIDIDAVDEFRVSFESRIGRSLAATASFTSFELIEPTSERLIDSDDYKGLSCTFGEEGGSIAITDRFGLRFKTPLTWSFGLVFHYAEDKLPGRRVVDSVTVVNPNGRTPLGSVRIVWL